MGVLLSQLGTKLAERWLSLLVLPGALYLAVAATGHTLGHLHPFDLARLTHQITAWARHPAASTVGGQVVLLAAILAGAAAAGLVAQALGLLTERLCLAADWSTWTASSGTHTSQYQAVLTSGGTSVVSKKMSELPFLAESLIFTS
ncbi:hypothetical protein [Streptomyces sp. NPDC058240]|uniref:hypothetical protein n=1 Tax=Streptomyces sp. NPDC058240 TaxID=3346396 RepID=UPI0036E39341